MKIEEKLAWIKVSPPYKQMTFLERLKNWECTLRNVERRGTRYFSSGNSLREWYKGTNSLFLSMQG